MSRRPGLGALLLLLLAVASSAFLNLAFTLPLILLGFALVLLSRCRFFGRWLMVREGGLYAGITAVMLGLAMSVVNLQRSGFWVNKVASDPTSAPSTPTPAAPSAPVDAKPRSVPRVVDEPSQHVADYGTPASEGAWVSGPQESLGYRYREGLKPLRARLIGKNSGREIYDVVYSFDAQGNRASVSSRSGSEAPIALFLGGSFMFGEGLNDQDTLPSQFAQASGLPVINAGMHGYGSHQAYRLLEDQALLRQRTAQRPIQLVVYRMIGNHAIRASGRYPWDRYGPCYQLSGSGDLSYQGSFHRCGKRWGFHNAASNVLQTLSNSREPFTREMAQTWERTLTEKRDRKRHLALIAGMKERAKQYGAKLIVVNETLSPSKTPDQSGNYGCAPDSEAIALGKELRQMGIRVLDTDQVLSVDRCTQGEWIIPGDGHPSAAANRQLARDLARLHQAALNSSSLPGKQQ